jgi:hypothetical protein
MKIEGVEVTVLQNVSGYYSKNSKWLGDLVYLLAMTLVMLSYEYLRSYLLSDPPGLEGIRPRPTPVWLIVATHGLGLSLSVYNAYRAGTVSAKIYLWAIMLLACGGFWFVVIRFIYSLFQ